MTQGIPVVDLFAGPGGLGEGFASFAARSGVRPFHSVLSIEKDPLAHKTLTLRAFRRQFEDEPEEYAQFRAGDLDIQTLYATFARKWARARDEAVLMELSERTAAKASELVHDRVKRTGSPWVLIGGPPCQAYSLVGRSRRMGIAGYVAATDVRQTLYLEYLQIIAEHSPPVFVMENVKGMLSARLAGRTIFERILADLRHPRSALKREGRSVGKNDPRYTIVPLVAPTADSEEDDPRSFVVRSELFGIPQARHRVILVGLLDGVVSRSKLQHLNPSAPRTVRQTIDHLPRLRSGVSKTGKDDFDSWISVLRGAARASWFRGIENPVRRRMSEAIECASESSLDRGSEFVRVGRKCSIANHSTRAHIATDLHRYLFASSFAAVHGWSPVLSDFPTELLPAHVSVARALEGGHFEDRFRVQVADRPSSTITSHISKDGHYFIHHDPSQCRSLTVREAAALQTFPDDYIFVGPRTSQYQQVGNAVPPALARKIAGVVHRLLE